MDSRLIFLHRASRLKQRDGAPDRIARLVVCVPQGRGHRVPKSAKEFPGKTAVDDTRGRTKTDTGRRGE